MNQELQNYIKQERDVGTDDETIKQSLRDNGWIDEMFNEYFGDNNTIPQKPYLHEHSQKAKKHNKLIFIIMASIIVFSIGVYFALAQGWINFNNNTVEKVIIEEIVKKEKIDTEDSLLTNINYNNINYKIDWLIYNKSCFDFTIKYPSFFSKIEASCITDNGVKIALFTYEPDENHDPGFAFAEMGLDNLEDENINNLEKLAVSLKNEKRKNYYFEENIAINENLFIYIHTQDYVEQEYWTIINDKIIIFDFNLRDLGTFEIRKDIARNIVSTLKFNLNL